MLLKVSILMRILTSLAHRRDEIPDARPDGPLLAGILEEEVLVDEAAIHHAGRHFPVAEDHADRCVAWSSGRRLLLQIIERLRMVIRKIPFAGLAHARLAAQLI